MSSFSFFLFPSFLGCSGAFSSSLAACGIQSFCDAVWAMGHRVSRPWERCLPRADGRARGLRRWMDRIDLPGVIVGLPLLLWCLNIWPFNAAPHKCCPLFSPVNPHSLLCSPLSPISSLFTVLQTDILCRCQLQWWWRRYSPRMRSPVMWC